MKTSLFFSGATLLALSLGAGAQTRPNLRGGATLPLPEGVKRVVALDAYNVLLTQNERDGGRSFGLIAPRHVYAGALARLFGGAIIPTQQFVSPTPINNGANNFNNFNNDNNAVFPAQQAGN